MSKVFVMTHNPGDGGKNTFRIEIGCDDGTTPTPLQTLMNMIWVGLDVAKESGFKDPKELFHEIVDAEHSLTKETLT